MIEDIRNQRDLWNEQHIERANEHRAIEGEPNEFAKHCIDFIPETGLILEIGSANGRDARFFAKERKCKVIAADFSLEALKQLKNAAVRDSTESFIRPVVADAKKLPIAEDVRLDAIYARSALHLSEDELDETLEFLLPKLKDGGYLMIEGKTDNDPKISKSREITPNLFIDQDGHVRRLWSEESIRQIIERFNLKLIEMNKTTKNRNGVESQFINFIALKL